MSEIHEEDILNAGKNQLIISNDKSKVVIVPELGGRIIDFQDGETSFLHKTYPEGVSFGPYTEYGGIEECIGGAPGTLWGVDWVWEEQNGGVLLQARSKHILVHKLISLDETEPVIKIDYSFFSFGDTFTKFTFGVHPEVNIGEALEENQYHVPTGGELLNGGYAEPGFKAKMPPSEGWCAVTHDGKVLGQMFPEGVVDVVTLYYPKVNTHMILQPIIFGVGVSPEMCAGFTYMLYMGDGDAEKVREIRAQRDAELTTKYEPFDMAEVSEDLLAELEERAGKAAAEMAGAEERRGPRPPVIPNVNIPNMPNMPQIPKIQVPDVAGIIQNALKNIPGVNININAGPADGNEAGSEKDYQTEELPPSTKISINHLKGNINVQGWDEPRLDYREVKGTVSTGHGDGVVNVKVESSGDCLLKVPREMSSLSLNFVNGEATVSDIASSLSVSGVRGKVDINNPKMPEESQITISMVSGDIDVAIAEDSSCSIFASSLSSGEISCELPLQEEERTRNQFKGILGDGAADVALSTVKGNISISLALSE